MSFAVPALAAERMAQRMALIKKRTCDTARDAEGIDPDRFYEYFKNRYLGLGIDLDGPELVGDSEVPLYAPPPRRPARDGYRWVLVDGKWKEVRQRTTGGG